MSAAPRFALAALVLGALFVPPAPAQVAAPQSGPRLQIPAQQGQGAPLPGAPGAAADNAAPIEIVARDGIEWDRENMRYVARGAAKVTQGDKTVEGDTLTAFYRQPPGGGTQIYRYTASGAVRMTTPTQKAVADRGARTSASTTGSTCARRGGRPARPQRRRQDHLFYMITGLVTPDYGPSSSTASTSPTCRCTAARGSASATCRRRPRSSAA
jgi:hypothetical protein